jgi:hypothetical protein
MNDQIGFRSVYHPFPIRTVGKIGVQNVNTVSVWCGRPREVANW